MKIDIGSAVKSTDGRDIGTIDRFLVDPETRDVRAAVIRKGMLLPRNIEAPISSLTPSLNGEIVLDMSEDEVKNLPEFQEAVYILPPPEYQLPDGYTAGSLYWPAGVMMGPPPNIPGMNVPTEQSLDLAVQEAARESEPELDFDGAVIGKGSSVVAHDGQILGRVEELSFDGKSGELSDLLVRSGLLIHHDRRIDSSLIETVEEGVITLKVDSDQLPA